MLLTQELGIAPEKQEWRAEMKDARAGSGSRIEEIPSRRARGAPRHRADAAAGKKTEARANSRQSGRRGVRPRAVQEEMENILRAIDGVGELRLMLHRGLRHEARAGAGYDRRAQRERGHEAQERDGRRRYGRRHAGGRGDEPRLSALRQGRSWSARAAAARACALP